MGSHIKRAITAAESWCNPLADQPKSSQVWQVMLSRIKYEPDCARFQRPVSIIYLADLSVREWNAESE